MVQPLVSLCMSTHSAPELFPRSLAGLLAQTYANLEILVLVNGGNPKALEILEGIKDPRLRWFVQKPAYSMERAFNEIVGKVAGKYYLFCSDDDILLTGAVDRQVALLEQHPNVGFCHADFANVDDDGKILNTWISHKGTWIMAKEESWPLFLTRTRCCFQATVVRTEFWKKVGGFDEAVGNPVDNSLYLKLLQFSDVGHVSGVVCHYRVRTRSPDSWERQFRNSQEFYALSKKHLDLPPSFLRSGSGKALLKRLRRRSLIDACQLIATTEDEEKIRNVRSWIETTVIPENKGYRAWRAVLQRRDWMKLLRKMNAWDNRARGIARSLLHKSS